MGEIFVKENPGAGYSCIVLCLWDASDVAFTHPLLLVITVIFSSIDTQWEKLKSAFLNALFLLASSPAFSQKLALKMKQKWSITGTV